MKLIETILENALDGVFIHLNGRILYMNDSFQSLLPEHLKDIHVGSPTELLFTGERSLESQITSQNSSDLTIGGRLPVKVKSIPFHYQSKDCVLCFVRSTAQEYLIKNRIETSNRMETLGLLAAGVAHEINNPLTYVSLTIEELKETLPVVSSKIEQLRRHIQTVSRY